MTEAGQVVVYFDGVCNLCNWAVDFIIRHDRSATIHFASRSRRSGSVHWSAWGYPRMS